MKYKLALIIFVGLSQCTQAQKVHHALAFTSKEINRVAVSSTYNYRFNAKDSADDAITYTVRNLPEWLSYSAVQQSISGNTSKPGQYPVQIIASTKSDTAYQNFMLTVYDKQTTSILCLGNSITNGTSTFNSYRRDLWKLLHNSNYNFDLIGSWSKHHMGGEMPDTDFDMDHEGHSGWTFEEILKPPSWDSGRGDLRTWVNEYTPDMALIELGTNDVFHCRTPKEMFGNLSVIVSILREKSAHVKIFLAQIPPLGKQWDTARYCGTALGENIIQLNKAMPSFVSQYSTARSPVLLVDQYTGVNTATDMYDDIHPNTKGEAEMALRWFNAMKKYLKKL